MSLFTRYITGWRECNIHIGPFLKVQVTFPLILLLKVESRVGFVSSPVFDGIITWLNFAENHTRTMSAGNGTGLMWICDW